MRYGRPLHRSLSSVQLSNLTDFTQSPLRRFLPTSPYHLDPGVHSKLLMQTSPVADDVDVVDDMKARRIRTVLEQIRSRDMRDVGDDRRSVLDELHSFANTVNGLDLPATASPRPNRHQLSYSDRLMQTRGDLKLLEQLVSQTFHWQPQQSAVSDVTDDQPQQVHPDAAMTTDEVLRHGAVDYTQSSSLAELACRWAEQRRLALEQEMKLRRSAETEYWPSDTASRLSLADSSRSLHHMDQYEAWNSALQAAQRPQVVDVAGTTSRLGHIRSASMSPGVSTDWRLSSSLMYTPKPHMSEARRKVRQVLCKSKGDPHYFSRKHSEHAND